MLRLPSKKIAPVSWPHLLSVSILLIAGAPPAFAAFFRVDEAIAYALSHNPELQAVTSQRDAAGAYRSAAEAGRLPRVGFQYSARSSDAPLDSLADKLNTRSVTAQDFDPARLNNPDRSTLYTTQFFVTLPLYTGGRLSAEIVTATELERHAQLSQERMRELVAFQTLRTYREAQAARAAATIANDALASAERHVRTVARLAREGRAVVSDQLTTEVNLANYRSASEQAATRAARAVDRLRQTMGLPFDEQIEIESPLPENGAPAINDTAILEQNAIATRKDIAAARAQLAAARSAIDSSNAAHKPRVGLVGASSWYNDQPAPENRSTSVMGVIAFDIYSGGQDSARTRAAVAQAEEQEWRVRSLETQARNEVRDASSALRESQTRYAIARENVGRALEAVRRVDQRYGQGRTILIDLLQAERALVEARSEELAARLGANVHAAALQLAEGTLALPLESTR